MADTYAESEMSDLLKRELPPIARRMADDVWMERFVVCFEGIAARLAGGRFASSQLASCTGEEMALHLVIDSAEAAVSDETIPLDDSLPADPERDRDFEWAREVLFRDHDVLLLFNPSLDGIEDNDSDLSQRHMFANLHPRRWFLPFPDQLDVVLLALVFLPDGIPDFGVGLGEKEKADGAAVVAERDRAATDVDLFPAHVADLHASRLQFRDQAANLSARYTIGGVGTTLATLTYSATDHAWLRLREAAGTVFWDTSPDGVTWTNRASTTAISPAMRNHEVDTAEHGRAAVAGPYAGQLEHQDTPWSTVSRPSWAPS